MRAPVPAYETFTERYARRFGWLGLATGLVFAVLGLTAFAFPGFWFTDNMSFFVRQLIAGSASALIGSWICFFLSGGFNPKRSMYCVILFLSLAGLCAFTIHRTLTLPVQTGTPAAIDNGMTVTTINLERQFFGDGSLVGYLKSVDADVIVFQEAAWWSQDRRWRTAGLEPGTGEDYVYPPHRAVGELNNLVVYSRFPISRQESIIVEGSPQSSWHPEREIMSLTLSVNGEPVDVIATHPASPRSPSRWNDREDYFRKLSTHLADLSASTSAGQIVIGDWNMSPWSGNFQSFLNAHRLTTRFPNDIPQTTRFFFAYELHWILGAIVDHIAVSEPFSLDTVRLGPDVGSDHLPLSGRITWTGQSQN
ncbi:endonuclease/exonuclease/phosphatase family protein [Roseibium hamelinense]|uniref:Endonuclease/exonuclease/phosphatase family protein n=1 Tax=Roseibium hamelinense TaxID=150831 RepID=A0A562SYP2_9HYPH|nr:endonuclease/exonuclease/phosphatase family protein [Roseibium hamelinense]MTI43650.1 endonuclease/exonuclease/phosphatase family protein [Roseibium hamelinense]TWI86168.1 endonuclease/exonuclease/phosphatase family protein [Roseibium hamelinense]